MDEQQAAQKEADLNAMERQRQLADAQRQIAEGNRVTPDQALINGKKAPTQFKTRPSVAVAENIAALEAQNTEATRHNTFASKVEEAKRNMLAKAIAALKKQGALIEDGDQLQWKDNKWSLFPPNYRGRPTAGYFYADIFNTEGKKIGKVLRPSRPTPPTPPEETTDAQENTGGDAKDGKQQGREKKPRRKATRRVSVSEAQGQSEANDAAQGSEVDADAQALIDLINKKEEEKKAAEAERLAAEARQRKEAEDEAAAIARDDSFDEDASFDLSNKSGRQQGANEVKKFLTKKSLAERKKNPTTVRDILQHYLDTAPEGGYQGLAQALLNIPGVATAPISFTVADEEGDLGVYRTSKGVIEIHDGGGWHTVFHEAVHAATVKGYVTDKKLRAAMDRLYAQVKVRAKRDGKEEQYGFTNALEFMSEALTNPEFQDYLSSIDFDENQNFWGRMVEAIRNFLQQFSPSNAPLGNALDAAIRVTTVAMQQTSAAGDIRVEDSALDAVLKNKAADAFTAYTDKLMDTSLGDVAGAARDTFNKLIVSANNTAFLAKWRPDLESLQKIHDAETKMQASQGKNANAVMDKVDDIRNLEKPERTKLFTLMVDSTRARMHPDRPLDDKTNAHIPNTPENEVLHRDLAARFNALTPDARKAYQETRDLFQKMFEQRTKALFALSERLLTEKKREQFKENINRLSKEMPGPYFPLARFGNYVSVWKSKDYAKAQKENDTTAMERLKRDPEHYVVSFHSSQAQASRALKKMIAKMGDRSALGTTEKVDGEKVDTKMHFSYALERNAYDGGVTMDLRPLLEKMQSAVETTVGAENSKEAKDALAEIFIASLSDTNVLKSALTSE